MRHDAWAVLGRMHGMRSDAGRGRTIESCGPLTVAGLSMLRAGPVHGMVGYRCMTSLTDTSLARAADARTDLRRAEALSHHKFEQAPIGIVYADRDGRVMRFNSAFCNLLGLRSREVETMSLAQLTYEADIEPMRASSNACGAARSTSSTSRSVTSARTASRYGCACRPHWCETRTVCPPAR